MYDDCVCALALARECWLNRRRGAVLVFSGREDPERGSDDFFSDW
jgi:hypothetical protein